MKRRDFLSLSIISLVLTPVNALAAVWNKTAFQAENRVDAEKGLSIFREIESKDIEIVAPSEAENGAIVQVVVRSHIANTEAIAIFVDQNSTALIGNFLFHPAAEPWLVTRINIAETSDIKIVVKSGHTYFTARQQVNVIENRCGESSRHDEPFKSSIKVRAKQQEDDREITQINAIITHPMHTGYSKDVEGQLIPAHFIQLVTIALNQQPVIEMQLGTGVSKNPYFTFHLNKAKLGDKITIVWHDNLGYSDQADTVVIA